MSNKNKNFWNDDEIKPLLKQVKLAALAKDNVTVNQLYPQLHKLFKQMVEVVSCRYPHNTRGLDHDAAISWIWIKYIQSYDVDYTGKVFSYFYNIVRSYLAEYYSGTEDIGLEHHKMRTSKTVRLSRDIVDSIVPEMKNPAKTKISKHKLKRLIRNRSLEWLLQHNNDPDFLAFVADFDDDDLYIRYHSIEGNNYKFILQATVKFISESNFTADVGDESCSILDSPVDNDAESMIVRDSNVDFPVLAEYVPDIPVSTRIRDLAIDICRALDVIHREEVEFERKNAIVSIVKNNLSRPSVSYTTLDFKLAWKVMTDAYKLYRQDM